MSRSVGGSRMPHSGATQIEDYFDVTVVDETFEIEGVRFRVVPTQHVSDKFCCGLVIDDRIWFSGDTRFDRDMAIEHGSRAEVIFHEVQFFEGGIHTGLSELSTLPESIRKQNGPDALQRRLGPPSEGRRRSGLHLGPKTRQLHVLNLSSTQVCRPFRSAPFARPDARSSRYPAWPNADPPADQQKAPRKTRHGYASRSRAEILPPFTCYTGRRTTKREELVDLIIASVLDEGTRAFNFDLLIGADLDVGGRCQPDHRIPPDGQASSRYHQTYRGCD